MAFSILESLGSWRRPANAAVGLVTMFGVVAVAPHAFAQEAVDLESGLELYWTFDEGEGDMAGDLTNQSRFGTIFDDPTFTDSVIEWTDGRFGDAVEFDLSYFLAANGFYGIGGTNPRTISIWINTTWVSDNQGVLVGFGPNNATERWHFKIHTADGEGNAPIRTENQGGNNFGAVPVNDGEWHHVVCVFPEGGSVIGDADHYIDGVLDETKNGGVGNPVNTNIDPALGAPPFTVGGSPFNAGFRYTEAVIDDVRIYNRALSAAEIQALANGEGVLSGAPPRIAFPEGLIGNPFVDTVDEPLEIDVVAVGDATIDGADISVTINGEPAGDAVSIDGSSDAYTVTISGLESNNDYDVAISATDSDGRQVTRSVGFSSYSFDNYTIEAENYNFEGGQFYDDPILCDTFGSEEGCYFDKMSVPGIDAFDSNGADDDSGALDIFRYSTGGADREEEFDTAPSGDLIRDEYDDIGIDEYDIDLMTAGDWANYTRTFEDDSTFEILLRASAGADQQFRLDRVVSAADSEDQELEPLGFFNVAAGAGYGFTELTDASGSAQLTVTLSGVETLRLTSVDGANNAALNYMMFVPSTVTTVLPTVAIAEPSEGALIPENQEVTISVDASDEDGSVVNVDIFSVDGDDRSLIVTLDSAPFSATVPSLPAGNLTLVAEATDNAGLIAVSEPVNVVVDSTPVALGVVRGSPELDAIELLFDDEVDPEGAAAASLYSVEPSLTIQDVIVDRHRVTLLTSAQDEGVTYTVSVAGVPDVNGVVLDSGSSTFEAAAMNLMYGLDGYWPFDEGAGNVAFDIAGSGHDAAIYDVPQYDGASVIRADGRFGGAINFDGSYFLGAPTYYGVGGSGARTISLWMNTSIEAVSADTLIGWGSGANTERYHFRLEGSNGVTLRTENAGGNNFGSVSVNSGEWLHIAAVFSGEDDTVGGVDHYINAVLDEEKNGGVTNPVNTNITPGVAQPVTLGGAPLGLGGTLRPLNGALLDDVRIYSRALSIEELEALAAGEGVVAGPVVSVDTPTLAIALDAGAPVLSWEGSATLQSASSVVGPWEDVADASSPHTASVDGTVFFRLVTE